ncbi:MAG: TolC family protein, partial [Thermodesulfobacteriota bacterium]
MRTKRWFLCGVIVTLIAAAVTAARAAETVKPLSLSESIDLALKRSVLIHAAREGVRGAEAQRKEAFTGFLPKFSTAYSYNRLNEEPTFNFPGAPPRIPASTIKTGTKENYAWSVEARQPLFAGGGILANYEASRIGTEIVRLEETATVQDLVQDVKIAYFNILKAGRIHAVARQSVERLTAHRDTAQGFYDVGIIPRNDLLYAEVELANGRQFLVRAENSLEMAKSKFNTLLRREINAPVEIEDTPNERPFAKPLDGCIAAALENRPEIRSYALRLEQAKSLVKLARSEYYPNVGLVGNYARYGDTPGVAGSPYRDQESWYVMAVANWNFWEWGKTKNRVDAGLSRENQAADILTNIREQIALEVKNAWLLLHEAEKQIHVAKKTTEQAEENFRINTERYREQVGTSTDVIDAQTLLTKARADHDNALGDYSISRAKLERAMGAAAPGGVE